MSQDEPGALIEAPAAPRRWLATRAGLVTLTGITALFLVLIGGWTYKTIETSLRELRSNSMQGQLDAQVNGLRVWISEALSDAERIARDPAVRGAILALVERAEREQAKGAEGLSLVCASAERAKVDAILRPLLADEGSAGHNVISPEGRLLSTRFPVYCGHAIHPERFRPLIAEVWQGKSKFVRPLRDADRVLEPPTLREGGPLAWMETPIRDDTGHVRAVLGIAAPAEAGFTAILAATRPGRSGEVYAFDGQGFMLSESRFLPELQRMGLLPTGAGALLEAMVRESPLLDSVRIPPLREGNQSGAENARKSDRPLTQLATAALAGSASRDPGAHKGILLDPYRSYHGSEVVGVWRWLPELDVAVAFEMEADEAYAPLRFLQVAYAAVLGALVVAVLAALGTGLLAAQFRLRFGSAQKAGAYVIQREIGEGGMANVYLAQHALLKRPTAIKILKLSRSSDEMVARFAREVQIASQLSHPNIVEVFDYGRTRDGRFYYAMEYLDGLTLSEVVQKSGPIPVARAVHLLRQVCAGLVEAHFRGLVHRDVKPENIMVCRRGSESDVVKILDFGLVKNIVDPHSRDLTRSLRILGTPLYMAPERIRSPGDVDARADIYAVGAVAFYILTGRKLFESQDDLELSQRVLNDVPALPSTLAPHAIPHELDQLILGCLAKKREDRPQSASELTETLDRLAIQNRWTQADAARWWEQVG